MALPETPNLLPDPPQTQELDLERNQNMTLPETPNLPRPTTNPGTKL